MNSVKDFTLGQRVSTPQGDGPVTKIGRKYVYVAVDGAPKDGQYLPEQVKVSMTKTVPPVTDEPVTVEDAPLVEGVDEMHVRLGLTGSGKTNIITQLAAQLDNAAPVGGRPPMRIKGKRADADNRRAARKAQRRSRRANRTR